MSVTELTIYIFFSDIKKGVVMFVTLNIVSGKIWKKKYTFAAKKSF